MSCQRDSDSERGHQMTVTASAGTQILVVEDDPGVGASLVALLAAEGHSVRWGQTCEAAMRLLEERTPELLLLDLTLPDGDGLQVCHSVRALHPEVVIVVVTARTDEADAVRALDVGADDVVLKPFRSSEMLARLRAHLRRRELTATPELRIGPLRLDLRSRRVWVEQVEVLLRPREMDLLTVLAESAGQAVRREALMDQVWDENWSGSTKTLDVHVANVRRRLSDAGDRWDRIVTLRGFGYRMDAD